MQVLVIEDEKRMAELLRRTIEEDGHSTVVARNGREGFEIARSSPFDVIVLDVMLPGQDGISVARKLRESRNQTPVLMLTARDAPSDVVAGLDTTSLAQHLVMPPQFGVVRRHRRAATRRPAGSWRPRGTWP